MGKFDDLRKDFPMLERQVNNKPFIYLNSAATTLKPRQVVEAMDTYYYTYGGTINRGVDSVGYEATLAYEAVRTQVAEFIGAKDPNTIVFTRGTTTSLNMIASSFGELIIEAGDEIVVCLSEHHANYIPWQQLAKRKGAKLVLAPLNDFGGVTPEGLQSVLSAKTKIVALHHISNVMGSHNDVKRLAELTHEVGAYFVADGAQGVVHEAVNVSDLDCDFYVFSAHKMVGPTGVGVLYGKPELLAMMPPTEFGGEMNHIVDIYDTSFKDAPHKFEAGTMMIAEVIGMGAAISYIEAIGIQAIHDHVSALREYAVEQLKQVPNVEIYNEHNHSSGIITYNHIGIHPHDAATVYDREGISMRSGHHCAQPLLTWLHQPATLRMSLYLYNNKADIDQWIVAAKQADSFLDALF